MYNSPWPAITRANPELFTNVNVVFTYEMYFEVEPPALRFFLVNLAARDIDVIKNIEIVSLVIRGIHPLWLVFYTIAGTNDHLLRYARDPAHFPNLDKIIE